MDEWDLPLIYRVGLSYKALDTEIHALTISADAIHPNDYDESVNIGCEYGFRERFFLSEVACKNIWSIMKFFRNR